MATTQALESTTSTGRLSDQLRLLADHRRGLLVTLPDGINLEAMAREANRLEVEVDRLGRMIPMDSYGRVVTQSAFNFVVEQRDNARSKVKRLVAAVRELHRQLNAWFRRHEREIASQEAATQKQAAKTRAARQV